MIASWRLWSSSTNNNKKTMLVAYSAAVVTRRRRCISSLLPTNTTIAYRARKNGPQKLRLLSSSTQRPSNHHQQQPPKWPAVAALMMVPAMFMAWGASSWVLSNQQIETNEKLRQAFLRQSSSAVGEYDTMPVLFHCVIRRSSGFTHCLSASSMQIGDVVEVLQEGVGPEELYNLCRLPAKHEMQSDAIGWFPTRWLQKLSNYDMMVQEQLKRLEKD